MTTMPRSIHLVCALSLTLAGALPMAQADTTPVSGAALSTAITGTVTIVNQETRMLTIKTPEGRFEVLHMPPEVQRLDEIKIGNRLTITQTELVLVDLIKNPEAGAIGVTRESEIVRNASEKPSGTMIESLTVTGVVESLDKAASKVTIKGPAETMTFKVRDPAVLDSVSPGDGVSATYLRAISGEVTSQ